MRASSWVTHDMMLWYAGFSVTAHWIGGFGAVGSLGCKVRAVWGSIE